MNFLCNADLQRCCRGLIPWPDRFRQRYAGFHYCTAQFTDDRVDRPNYSDPCTIQVGVSGRGINVFISRLSSLLHYFAVSTVKLVACRCWALICKNSLSTSDRKQSFEKYKHIFENGKMTAGVAHLLEQQTLSIFSPPLSILTERIIFRWKWKRDEVSITITLQWKRFLSSFRYFNSCK